MDNLSQVSRGLECTLRVQGEDEGKLHLILVGVRARPLPTSAL